MKPARNRQKAKGKTQKVNRFSYHISRITGFTLIELLVAISIIGILATLALANFNAARARARDAQRKADLRQIQNALRVYYNDKGSYPTHNATNYTINGCGASGTSECPWASSWTAGTQTYMSTLPRDPAPNFSYRYVRVDADNYSLKACFENRSDDKCSPTAEGWCNTTLNGCVYEAKP